jgi:hypothetical protein
VCRRQSKYLLFVTSAEQSKVNKLVAHAYAKVASGGGGILYHRYLWICQAWTKKVENQWSRITNKCLELQCIVEKAHHVKCTACLIFVFFWVSISFHQTCQEYLGIWGLIIGFKGNQLRYNRLVEMIADTSKKSLWFIYYNS